MVRRCGCDHRDLGPGLRARVVHRNPQSSITAATIGAEHAPIVRSNPERLNWHQLPVGMEQRP